jgi:hypothetical protein
VPPEGACEVSKMIQKRLMSILKVDEMKKKREKRGPLVTHLAD